MAGKKRMIKPLIALVVATTVGIALACTSSTTTRGIDDGSSAGDGPGGDVVSGVPSTPSPGVTPSLPDSDVGTSPEPQSFPRIEPDPDFKEKLARAGISTRGWETDFSLHIVPFDEILSGGPPRDGIPPLDTPQFVTVEEADRWLRPGEPVIVFGINGDYRAYPLQIMTWHEIANDVVGDVPVTVTFCPLCNSAIVFDRRLDGVVHDFGTSGMLLKSNLVMWDRQTESWWQQFTGEGIVGELAGKKLTFLVSSIISWKDFKNANPEGKVLSQDTGFSRPYGRNPYAGYDRVDNPPFLFDRELNGRLLPKERVVAVEIGDVAAAFPFSILSDERVVNYKVNGQDLVVLFDPDTRSAFLDRSTGDFKAVGSSGVFDPRLDGQKLTFKLDGDRFVDDQTGSVWNILGEAIEGPLAGKKLGTILHGDHFWFAFGAFRPDTLIYQGEGRQSTRG